MGISNRRNFLGPLKKYWQSTFYALMLLGLSMFGLFWLAIGVLGLAALYKLVLHLIHKIKYNSVRKTIKGFFLFLVVFTMSIGIKLFVVDIYRIPSSSMENTLFPGDVILVNKLVYGPKLPRNPFEISWVNLLFYLNEKARAAMEKTWWPYTRLRGSGYIRQGDILVYQLSRTFFVVKRCVAVAGDTLIIRNGEVFTNGKVYTPPTTVRNNFRLRAMNRRRLYAQMDSLGVKASVGYYKGFPGYIKGAFSEEERTKVGKLPMVKAIEQVLDTFDKKKGLFSMPRGTFWTLDEMGPIIVPKKGMQIVLNGFTFDLYKKVLREHEGRILTETENGYYDENGREVDMHTFKQDYFFVMGDNRKGSMDSRYIGFIPEEGIIGKVPGILFSNFQGEFRWERLVKSLD